MRRLSAADIYANQMKYPQNAARHKFNSNGINFLLRIFMP